MHPGKILPMSPGRYTSSRACTLACGLAVWEHADAARAPACSSWRNPHQGCRCMHLVVNAVQQLSFAGPRTSAKQQSSMIYLPYKQVGPPSTKRPLVLHTPKLVMALQNIVRKGALELSSAVRAVSSTAVSHGVLSHVEGTGCAVSTKSQCNLGDCWIQPDVVCRTLFWESQRTFWLTRRKIK
jgi:hypothetical protein